MTVQITTMNSKPRSHARAFPPSPFRLFEDLFNDWAIRSLQHGKERDHWIPPVDVMERDGNIIVKMEVTGVQEKDIEIKVAGGVLTVTGEKKPADKTNAASFHQTEIRHGSFSRSFTLPDSVDADKISASSRNGILTITLPSRPESKSRSIKIQTH